MKIVIFGLAVSSSWGNGHATLWRGLCGALAARGHSVVFYERDVPWYSAHRDLTELSGGARLVLYEDWESVCRAAGTDLRDADVAIVTSYCPDALAATGHALDSPVPLRVFYDLDTPVTLERIQAGLPVDYIGPRGLSDFDLVLSYTGGNSLARLRSMLGARLTVPLYGSVDPSVHTCVAPNARFAGDLGYIGTYGADRQDALQSLFAEPARLLPDARFLLAGSMFGEEFPWQPNIFYVGHLPPADHAAFYCSTRLTLNVTRQAMARTGYCPSARLFEAAACGAAVLSDRWEGIDLFFEPGSEILLARTSEDTLAALARSPDDLTRIGRAARIRAMENHTAAARAIELESILRNAYASRQTAPQAAVEVA